MQNNKNCMFITFEGIDGCGKTTQLELVNNYLKNKNCKTFVTLEPGGSDIGKSLREILLHYDGYVCGVCETLLYLADRAQHVECVILNNIKQGKIVLCDRYTDSTVAYQGYGRNKNIEQINLLNKIATQNYKPDLTFLFDVDIETAQQRIGNNKDRMEQENIDFHKKVKYGYLELAKLYPKRIKIINSNLSIEETFAQVKNILDKYYE